MITIFRRIRQKLLTANNISKYLIYAIGEILLVMIGILLALQVNNWSEERKKENIVATYKKSLTEDLRKEIIKSQRAISEMEKELEELFTVSEKITNNPLNIDSIVNIYRFEFNPEVSSWDINIITLDALISTGNINLLDKDLYNSLMALKSIQEQTIHTIETNMNFYQIYSTRLNVPFHDDWNAFGGEALERIWEDIDKNGFLRDFSATLTSRILINEFIIEARRELVKETEAVLRMLN